MIEKSKFIGNYSHSVQKIIFLSAQLRRIKIALLCIYELESVMIMIIR